MYPFPHSSLFPSFLASLSIFACPFPSGLLRFFSSSWFTLIRMKVVLFPALCTSSLNRLVDPTLCNDGPSFLYSPFHMCGRTVHLMEPKYEEIHVVAWWPATHRKFCLKGEPLSFTMINLEGITVAATSQIENVNLLWCTTKLQFVSVYAGRAKDPKIKVMDNR
jgi:hypothetical protein